MARKKVETNISYDDVRKTYYVSLYYGTDDNGKLIQRKKTAKNIREARKILREHEVDMDRQQAVPSSRETVAEHIRWYLEHVVRPHREATTVYGYEKMAENHLIPVLGAWKLDKLTSAHIQEYITQKQAAGLSANTIIKHIDFLKSALKNAVGSGKILKNPADFVTRPKKVKKEIKPYSAEAVRRMLAIAKEEGSWFYVFLVLVSYTGLRRGEVLGLRWEDIDFEAGEFCVRNSRTTAGGVEVIKGPKTESSNRKLKLVPELIEILAEERRKQEDLKQYFDPGEFNPDGYVIVKETGKPPLPNAVDNKIGYMVKYKGFPPITIHGLRHTVASLLHQSGATAFEAQHALGHSSTAVTLGIYTHMYQEANEGAMEKVAAALSATEKDDGKAELPSED